MNPKSRSVLFAVVGGMMAAAVLHAEGIVDFSFGFQKGGLIEGALMAISGALAGWLILFAYRKTRGLAGRDTE